MTAGTWRARRWACGLALTAAFAAQSAHAQLQITEIMGNPVSFNDDVWEWIEVRNTGATEVDLDGYFIDRIGDPQIPPGSATPSIVLGQTTNTKIPAGGVAVIYDGDISINAGDFNDAMFRQAWGLAPTTPLIAAAFNFGGGLSNTGNASLGFWPNYGAYQMDVADDGMGTIRVQNFNNATFGLDFRTAEPSSFPAYDNGVSLRWNGTGDWKTGANWGPTTTGTTSTLVTIPGATNSTQDTGNPGVIPPSASTPTSLMITEIMYDPRSTAVNNIEQWEWVEIYNGGPTINFGTTPYLFHDTTTTADLTAPNITSGVLSTGGIAVLYNDAISQADMAAAWDPGGARGTLFIPVSDFPALANGGDTIAIWDSLTDYQADSADPSPRRTANAAVMQLYDDEAPAGTGWPTNDGNASIYITDLSLSPTDPASWTLSFVNPPAPDPANSFFATAVNGTVTIHPGGDLGTPGTFGVVTPTNNSDFDNDNDVDGHDFLIWQRGLVASGVPAGDKSTGDADGDGDVDATDLGIWQSRYSLTPATGAIGAVPEPAACGLLAVGLLAVAGVRRRLGK